MTESLAPINPATAHNVPEYTVSDIAGAVKRMVEERFGRVRIRGEISGWKLHSSGHAYFSLKDENAVLASVCWRGSVGKIPFKPEDGLEVIASGRITTYPGQSKYQIVVDMMEPAGAGALMAILEKRKAMLAAEGLFAPERKKPLPFLPRTIGIVTSPTGAVIRDIVHRLAERCGAHVIVWPVAVQGDGAAEQVAAAINGFQMMTPKPDVLIVARGGGSIEDLWAFNEEIVVRAAAASAIPLISAVGHETDTTLIDFASDRRAPTPTAAAEMAVPVKNDLLLVTSEMGVRLQGGVQRLIKMRRDRVEGLARGLPRPQMILAHAMQRLDDWSERLRLALMQKASPQLGIRANELAERLTRAATRLVADKLRQLESRAQLLASLDHRNVLRRGFALVRGNDAVVTSAAAARKEKQLQIIFHDGDVTAEVTS